MIKNPLPTRSHMVAVAVFSLRHPCIRSRGRIENAILLPCPSIRNSCRIVPQLAIRRTQSTEPIASENPDLRASLHLWLKRGGCAIIELIDGSDKSSRLWAVESRNKKNGSVEEKSQNRADVDDYYILKPRLHSLSLPIALTVFRKPVGSEHISPPCHIANTLAPRPSTIEFKSLLSPISLQLLYRLVTQDAFLVSKYIMFVAFMLSSRRFSGTPRILGTVSLPALSTSSLLSITGVFSIMFQASFPF